MAAITDPSGTSNQTGDSLKELHDRLDSLWARYLQLLDDYTAANTSLQKHLAASYFSLMQANFQSSGRRYGADFYDDRAVASVTVQMEDGGQMIISKHGGKEATSQDHADQPQDEMTSGAEQLPSPSPTPEPEDDHMDDKDDAGGAAPPKSAETSDPLRWFGILVPPSLRAAQKSFISAVLDKDALAKAVNAAREMRTVEAYIRKLRKTIKKSEREGSA